MSLADLLKCIYGFLTQGTNILLTGYKNVPTGKDKKAHHYLQAFSTGNY